MSSLNYQRSKQFMYRYLTNNDEAESYDLAILVKDSNFDAEMLHGYNGSYGFGVDGKPKADEQKYH